MYGITPACAGKSVCIVASSDLRRNHPRVRGEESGMFDKESTITESPPRARGRVS